LLCATAKAPPASLPGSVRSGLLGCPAAAHSPLTMPEAPMIRPVRYRCSEAAAPMRAPPASPRAHDAGTDNPRTGTATAAAAAAVAAAAEASPAAPPSPKLEAAPAAVAAAITFSRGRRQRRPWKLRTGEGPEGGSLAREARKSAV